MGLFKPSLVTLLFCLCVSGADDAKVSPFVEPILKETATDMKSLKVKASDYEDTAAAEKSSAIDTAVSDPRESFAHSHKAIVAVQSAIKMEEEAKTLWEEKDSVGEAKSVYNANPENYTAAESYYNASADAMEDMESMIMTAYMNYKEGGEAALKEMSKGATGSLMSSLQELNASMSDSPAYTNTSTLAEIKGNVSMLANRSTEVMNVLKEEEKTASNIDTIRVQVEAATGAAKAMEHAADQARQSVDKAEEAEMETAKHANASMAAKDNDTVSCAKALSDAVKKTLTITKMAVQVAMHGQASHVNHSKEVIAKAKTVASAVLAVSTKVAVRAEAKTLRRLGQEGKASEELYHAHRRTLFGHAIQSVRNWIKAARKAAEMAKKKGKTQIGSSLNAAADLASVSAKAAETATPTNAHRLANVVHDATRMAAVAAEHVHEALRNASEKAKAEKAAAEKAAAKPYTADEAVLRARLNAAEIAMEAIKDRLEKMRAMEKAAKHEMAIASAMKLVTTDRSQGTLEKTGLQAAKALQHAANAIRHALHYHFRPKRIDHAIKVLAGAKKHASDADRMTLSTGVRALVTKLRDFAAHGYRMDGEIHRHKGDAIRHAMEAARHAIVAAKHAADVAEKHRTGESLDIAEALRKAGDAVEVAVGGLEKGEAKRRHLDGEKVHRALHKARQIAGEVFHVIRKIMAEHRAELAKKEEAERAEYKRRNMTIIEVKLARAQHAVSITTSMMKKMSLAAHQANRAHAEVKEMTAMAQKMTVPHQKTRAVVDALYAAVKAAQHAKQVAEHHRDTVYRDSVKHFQMAKKHAEETKQNAKMREEHDMAAKINKTAKQGKMMASMATTEKMNTVKIAAQAVAKALEAAKEAALHAAKNHSQNATVQQMMATVHGAAVYGHAAVDATKFYNDATTSSSTDQHHDKVHGALYKLVEAAVKTRDKMENFTRVVTLANGKRIVVEARVEMKTSYNVTNRTAQLRDEIVEFIDESRELHQFAESVKIYSAKADNLIIPPLRHGESACTVIRTLSHVLGSIVHLVSESYKQWEQLHKDYNENNHLGYQALSQLRQVMTNNSEEMKKDNTHTLATLNSVMKDAFERWRGKVHHYLITQDGHQYQTILHHISSRVRASTGLHLTQYVSKAISMAAMGHQLGHELQEVAGSLEKNLFGLLHGTLVRAHGALHAVRNDLHYLEGSASRLHCSGGAPNYMSYGHEQPVYY